MNQPKVIWLGVGIGFLWVGFGMLMSLIWMPLGWPFMAVGVGWFFLSVCL